jgi:hypothetical protein
VQVFRLSPSDRFLLLGCDGFFGVFNEDAAAMTAQLLGEGRTAKGVCDRLINEVWAVVLLTGQITTFKVIACVDNSLCTCPSGSPQEALQGQLHGAPHCFQAWPVLSG